MTAADHDLHVQSIAHGVISLEYVPVEYGRQRHAMRVVKMRGVNFQSGLHDFNIETGQGRSSVAVTSTAVGATLNVIGLDAADAVSVAGSWAVRTLRESSNTK